MCYEGGLGTTEQGLAAQPIAVDLDRCSEAVGAVFALSGIFSSLYLYFFTPQNTAVSEAHRAIFSILAEKGSLRPSYNNLCSIQVFGD
jgi:hypothetical protein